jgi:hypothetical protein
VLYRSINKACIIKYLLIYLFTSFVMPDSFWVIFCGPVHVGWRKVNPSLSGFMQQQANDDHECHDPFFSEGNSEMANQARQHVEDLLPFRVTVEPHNLVIARGVYGHGLLYSHIYAHYKRFCLYIISYVCFL